MGALVNGWKTTALSRRELHRREGMDVLGVVAGVVAASWIGNQSRRG